ncbi:hypothetical protein QVD17_19634 [Tagetes erecta]|uniref:Uncharacterized protein n=1 Tax=Tagetes erecta TaxID=13708 RepID=A0AAD8NX35_TARER|nr:hypothetical protein QVD17_19634 [Tagetes erecta]
MLDLVSRLWINKTISIFALFLIRMLGFWFGNNPARILLCMVCFMVKSLGLEVYKTSFLPNPVWALIQLGFGQGYSTRIVDQINSGRVGFYKGKNLPGET